ncbi:hypothetical protein KsCSTR_16410 [Candidatus Kuenenia stuttgartiensis]|nr:MULTISPECIES: glycosyltransferase family 1 protein [Kuenenia]MCZ7621586.1 glycosyltransferase family 4 protein [Candidatus Kuenenia sp.]QII11020.1 hypothetical protein KsCSTR_16410 [Candidatus Kuenenia stuttgartiensis]
MKDLGISKTCHIAIYLVAHPSMGGTFQYTLTVLKAFAKIKENNRNGVSILCITLTKDWNDLLKKDYPQFSVTHIHRNIFHKAVGKVLKSTKFGWFVWRKINKLLPFAYKDIFKMNLDLILYPSQDDIVHEIDIPAISVIHDLMHRYEKQFPESCSIQEIERRERQYKKICKFSTIIIVDSKVGEKQVEESYGNILKAKVIPLPFIPPPYILEHNPTIDFTYVIEKYKLHSKYVFYPAQFWTHKNHHNLLKAIDLLKDKGIKVNAVFVGSKKNNYKNVIDLINILSLGEQIRIIDYVPNEDIVALYKNSIALVMPTFFGPTNIPIVEAMFLGVPVICSNVYAMQEQVGNAGLLFDPKSINGIADSIYRIWTDENLRKGLIQRGYKKVKNITIENYTKQWENIIMEALKR